MLQTTSHTTTVGVHDVIGCLFNDKAVMLSLALLITLVKSNVLVNVSQSHTALNTNTGHWATAIPMTRLPLVSTRTPSQRHSITSWVNTNWCCLVTGKQHAQVTVKQLTIEFDTNHYITTKYTVLKKKKK